MERDRLLDLYLSEAIEKSAYAAKAGELDRREEFLAREVRRLLRTK